MNFLVIWLVVFVSSAALNAAPTKIDPALRLATQTAANPGLSKALNVAVAEGERRAEAFVKTRDAATTAAMVEQWGGKVRSRVHQILTIELPLQHLDALAALEEVIYVEAAKPVRVKLNQTLPLIDVDDVHSASAAVAAGLDTNYTGSGVIVGVVDSGLDCDHADWNDDSGNTRLLSYWDQTSGSDGVSEVEGTSGTEYIADTIADESCVSAPDSEAHGTHVTGIAVSNDDTYTGVAPAATLVAVKHNAIDADSAGTFATRVTEAVDYIFRKAQAQSPRKPAVVNLSLGTSIGAHDGTSLFEQSLDGLLLESGTTEKQGRAIVNAAGNENFSSASSAAADFGGIHATINQTSANVAYDFVIGVASPRSQAAAVFADAGAVLVDIWLDAGSDCTIEVDATEDDDKENVRIDMAAVAAGGSAAAADNADSAIQIGLDFTDSDNANNGKQHALVSISRVSSSESAEDYAYDLIFNGTCTGDAWLYPDFTASVSFRKSTALSVATHSAGYTYKSGDSNSTMTIPSTANRVLAVGSFMGDPATWVDINNNTRDQFSVTGGTAGNISLFSSLGPTPDGRVKPDLSAPGEPVVSTLASTASAASSNKGDATHVKIEGTSMSAPHVTGTIALMLERNGCLTPAQIKDALSNSATSDSATGSVPNNAWGAGKLNTLAAVQAVSAASCVPNNPSEDVTSSGGCALLR